MLNIIGVFALFVFKLHPEMLFEDAHLVMLCTEYVILVVDIKVDVRLLCQLWVPQQLSLVINCVKRRKNCILRTNSRFSSSV